MSKVIVIGGGPAGLVAAIYAARENNEVTILEKNVNCSKKLLITGNGRCNYYNSDQDIKHYHTSSNVCLEGILTAEMHNEILNFLDTIGVVPKIKNGYYYPMANQAISIANALIKEADLSNVEVKNNITVTDIIKENNQFKIITDYEDYYCDKVIITTGSKAAPKTGSDGFGYTLLKKMGHKIIKPLPALVQLISNDKITSAWDGVRSDASCKLYIDNEFAKQEDGEIMLTEYGVSGICIFNLSGAVAASLDKGSNVFIKINFLSNLGLSDVASALSWFDGYNQKVEGRTITELLDNLMNYKLVNAILKKLHIDSEDNWQDLKASVKESLVKSLIAYEINITATNSFDKAQVCSGGVSLEEVNLATMESKIIPNLYLAGEILDVDGDCGGYNLTWSWASGILAGKGTGNND